MHTNNSRRDLDIFLHRRERQLEIQLATLIYLQLDAFGFGGLKSLLIHMHRVVGHAEQRNHIVTVPVCHRFTGGTRGRRRDCHFRASDSSARRIGYRTRDTPGCLTVK